MNDNIQEIFLDKIDDPQHAMRGEVRDESIFILADNIKANGLINPITVRPKDGRFEVVAGHRRFTACKLNGMVRIKCVVRELTDQETFAVMAAENLERKDVDVVDEARFIREYMDQTGADLSGTAKALRRSEKYVKDRLLVGEMPDYAIQYLKEGRLKLGVALALTQISNERLRESWIHNAVAGGISVATAEYQLQDYNANKHMYDGVVAEAAQNGSLPQAKPVMFRCAFSDEEVDARLCRAVFIKEEYLPLIGEYGRAHFASDANPANPAG